ncbi:hypothetical protein J8J40_23015, partial [Mycobacterium tuberculosis]|nr:hypothetical protein [Mycobacterium tuberculosis]
RCSQTARRAWAWARPHARCRPTPEAGGGLVNDEYRSRPPAAHNGIPPFTRLNNLLGNDI